MRKLSLADWASVAQIAGTVAVVISLLLVASSLERNTAAVSGQTADDVYNAMEQINFTVLDSPELLLVTIRGKDDSAGLSQLEREQYKLWVVTHLNIWERMLVRVNEGLIKPETIEGWPEWFEEWARRNLPEEIWDELRWNYPGGDFAARVDAAQNEVRQRVPVRPEP